MSGAIESRHREQRAWRERRERARAAERARARRVALLLGAAFVAALSAPVLLSLALGWL